jgi:hypothetical protein
MAKENVLGVDFGGVIIDREGDDWKTSTFYSDGYLAAPAFNGVFAALRTLQSRKFGSNIYIVSRANEEHEQRIIDWLVWHKFYDKTGVALNHLRFCRERAEKAGICKRLGITHFVDDRFEVVSRLTTVSHRYLLHPRPDELEQFTASRVRARHVESWEEIVADIIH